MSEIRDARVVVRKATHIRFSAPSIYSRLNGKATSIHTTVKTLLARARICRCLVVILHSTDFVFPLRQRVTLLKAGEYGKFIFTCTCHGENGGMPGTLIHTKRSGCIFAQPPRNLRDTFRKVFATRNCARREKSAEKINHSWDTLWVEIFCRSSKVPKTVSVNYCLCL